MIWAKSWKKTSCTRGKSWTGYNQKNRTVSLDHNQICQQKSLDRMEQSKQWTKRHWKVARGGWILQCQLQEDFSFYVCICDIFDLCFVKDVNLCLELLYVNIQFFQHNLLTIFSPLLPSQRSLDLLWTYSQAFYYVHWPICLFLCCCFTALNAVTLY